MVAIAETDRGDDVTIRTTRTNVPTALLYLVFGVCKLWQARDRLALVRLPRIARSA